MIYLVFAMIITGIVMLAVALYMAIERSSYEKPAKTSDDSFLNYQRCDFCKHGEISMDFPKIACAIHGKHMEPTDRCKELA